MKVGARRVLQNLGLGVGKGFGGEGWRWGRGEVRVGIRLYNNRVANGCVVIHWSNPLPPLAVWFSAPVSEAGVQDGGRKTDGGAEHLVVFGGICGCQIGDTHFQQRAMGDNRLLEPKYRTNNRLKKIGGNVRKAKIWDIINSTVY